MFTNHIPKKFFLLGTLVAVSLIASACSSSNVVTTPVVEKPTLAPTQALPTAPATTIATPSGAGNSKPASAPAAKPTAKPTEMPTPKQTEKPAPITTAAPAATSLHIGAAQSAGEVSILPSKYEIMDSLGSNKPKAGDEYLVVTFTIDNQSKTASYDFAPDNFKILDSSGKPISMASLKSVSNELSAKMLKPGEKIQGVIVYELPTKDKPLTLEFENSKSQTLMWAIS
jgi:hypothetical protein